MSRYRDKHPKLEEVVLVKGDDGREQVFHFHEVGLSGASCKEDWIEALEAYGYTGYGKSWTFDEGDFLA